MINPVDVDRLHDCEVLDERGKRIGSVKRVWLDDEDGRLVWASVHTGLLGLRERFVPIQQAAIDEQTIVVPFAKQWVRDSPHLEVAGEVLTDAQQAELYSYYGVTPRTGDHDRLTGSGFSGGRAISDRIASARWPTADEDEPGSAR